MLSQKISDAVSKLPSALLFGCDYLKHFSIKKLKVGIYYYIHLQDLNEVIPSRDQKSRIKIYIPTVILFTAIIYSFEHMAFI